MIDYRISIIGFVYLKSFTYIDTEKTIDEADILQTLNDILEDRDRMFASVMNQLNYQQKETLVAIAKEGKTSGVTSVAFVKKHALKSPQFRSVCHQHPIGKATDYLSK